MESEKRNSRRVAELSLVRLASSVSVVYQVRWRTGDRQEVKENEIEGKTGRMRNR